MTPITRRLLSGLLATTVTLALALMGPPARATSATTSLGTITAYDALLRKGTNTYALDYAVTAPTGEWLLEVTVTDRLGRQVASPAALSDAWPDAGPLTFQLPRPGTRPGIFTVTTKVTWYEGWKSYSGTLDPVTFKLRKPHIKKRPRR